MRFTALQSITRYTTERMNLEQQVCSLDLAKRLKELGLKQESEHWWVESYDQAYKGRSWWLCRTRDNDDTVNPHVSAFTVAELGEMLPATLGEPNAPKQIDVEMYVYHSPRRYEVVVSDYVDMEVDGRMQHIPHQIYHAIEPTEADGRAKMLIYLLENKLVTL